MRSFDELLAIAAERKGSAEAALAGSATMRSPAAIAATPDAEWLATMARSIFQAGISWQVVDNKWAGITEAFHAFDIGRNALMPEDAFDDLLADTRVIRSAPKIRAIQENAVFIQEVSAEVGSFGRKVADWPASDFGGLVVWMRKNGARLGGNTAPYVLRQMGKDGYILSNDVVARLVAEGVVDGPPNSVRAMAAVQEAFNTWSTQSGRPLHQISRVLAQSIDA